MTQLAQVGTYLFTRNGSTIELNVTVNALMIIEQKYDMSLPAWLDMEWNKEGVLGKANILFHLQVGEAKMDLVEILEKFFWPYPTTDAEKAALEADMLKMLAGVMAKNYQDAVAAILESREGSKKKAPKSGLLKSMSFSLSTLWRWATRWMKPRQ